MPRRIPALAAAAVACLVAAGCGGDDTGPDLTSGLEPAEVIRRSADAADKAGSFRFEVDATSTGPRAAGASGPALLLAGDVELTADGRAGSPKLLTVDVELATSVLPVQATLSRVGDALFLSFLGRDYRLDVARRALTRSRPERLPSALLGWIDDPAEAGREEVDGEATVRYRGRFSERGMRGLVAAVAPIVGRPAPAAGAPADPQDGEMEVWVGTEDLLPRRVRFTARSGSRLPLVAGLGPVRADVTVSLHGYGTSVEVEAPERAEPLSFDDLAALAG